MRMFGCFAQIESLSTNGVELFDEAEIEEENKAHDLTPLQNQKLQEIRAQFPSFLDRGLGKTHLQTHTIDTGDALPVKDRHYPVPPAVQKLLYAELDRMLGLGVIEESQSPWSHPVTLVRKGDKNRLSRCPQIKCPHHQGRLSLTTYRRALEQVGRYILYLKYRS